MLARLVFCGIAISVIVGIAPNAISQERQEESFYVHNGCSGPIRFYIRSLHPRSPSGWVGPARIPPGETWGYSLEKIGYEPFEIYIYQGEMVLRFEREYLCSLMDECKRTGQVDWMRTATIGHVERRRRGLVFIAEPRPNKMRLSAFVDENTVTFTYGLRACAYYRNFKDIDDPNPDRPDDEDEELRGRQ